MFARAASLIVVALVSSAAVAAGQIASVTRISLRGTTGVFSQYLVDVTLDREICFAAAGSSASSLNMLWPQGLVQMRVDSGVVSIVIDPQPVVPSCLGSNNVTVLLPPLEPGDYSVRVAAAERRLTSSGNGNSLIGPSASLSLRQVADLPTGSAIPVYGIAEGAHTALTLQDLGPVSFSR